jgi:hypothetical protein
MRIRHHWYFLLVLICFACALSGTPLLAQAGENKAQQPTGMQDGNRRIPRQRNDIAGIIGRVQGKNAQLPASVRVVLTNLSSATAPKNKATELPADTDGIFRAALLGGTYSLSVEAPGFETFRKDDVVLNAGEVLTVEVMLQPSATSSAGPSPAAPSDRHIASNNPPAESAEAPYRELSRRADENLAEINTSSIAPSNDQLFLARPDRWKTSMPSWDRYQHKGDYPYVLGHWWDPFNRNKFKGDYPVFGQQTFFNFTGTSVTAFDWRRLPTPSGVSTALPGNPGFFGRGEQEFIQETVRTSFDLFHGDTSFKPADWRIRVTPAFNVNQIWTRELAIVNRDVRAGRDRTDGHVGLQEAFAELKLKNIGPSYDFVSVRAGIQQFTSDFRGFVFSEEQPGVRIFGNLNSSRIEYNAAYFNFLEKDTNSGLNSFRRRDQQVLIANLYYQDFLKKGYTAQISYHFNKDDASVHFDENDFLERPAPIGAVKPHNIRSHYIGLTGNGHVGRFNLSNAFYQVLGHDDLNPVAGRYVSIDAQMAAVELSYDKDWMRFRSSFFFASGSRDPRSSVARGFDSIVEAQTFAGGIFSFFNREGIRLTGTGVALTSPESFLPDLRASKEEGQSNFVNPGIVLGNVGADFDLTPKLRAVVNANFMRFHRTQSLELLLFQSNIKSSIGADYSIGFIYRPPLSENIVLTGGVASLVPGEGLRQIYTSKTLVSGFTALKFQF